MQFSTLYHQIKSNIEENWRLMNPTVVENQLQQLMEVDRITEEEYKALMHFFDEQFQTNQ